jgi:hypothetical protein
MPFVALGDFGGRTRLLDVLPLFTFSKNQPSEIACAISVFYHTHLLNFAFWTNINRLANGALWSRSDKKGLLLLCTFFPFLGSSSR